MKSDKKKRYSERRRKRKKHFLFIQFSLSIRRNDTLKGDRNIISVYCLLPDPNYKKKRYSERRRKRNSFYCFVCVSRIRRNDTLKGDGNQELGTIIGRELSIRRNDTLKRDNNFHILNRIKFLLSSTILKK